MAPAVKQTVKSLVNPYLHFKGLTPDVEQPDVYTEDIKEFFRTQLRKNLDLHILGADGVGRLAESALSIICH